MRTVRLSREQSFTGPLVLVNRQHPLRTAAGEGLTAVDGRHPDILLDRQAARLLAACIQKVRGGAEIVPVSGWRSQEEQQRIWDDTLAESGPDFTRTDVAYPGCSEHQTGLAIDLGRAAGVIDFIRPAFPYDGICGAFRKAAAAYGFIQRYRREKESLTGIAEEPWHFRYVGRPHARLMRDMGLTLEEYVELLRGYPYPGRLLSAAGGGYDAFVGFSRSYTPQEHRAPCQVSGNNVDGYILTLWRLPA